MDDMINDIKKRAGVSESDLAEAGLTRKHFVAIADAIKAIPDANIKADMAQRLGNVMQDMNPRFDWNRWNGHIGV